MNTNQLTFTCESNQSSITLRVSFTINENIKVNNTFLFGKDLPLYEFTQNDNKKISAEKLMNIDWNQNWNLYCVTDEDSATMSCIKYNSENNTINMSCQPNMGYGSKLTLTVDEYTRENIQRVICELIHLLNTKNEEDEE